MKRIILIFSLSCFMPLLDAAAKECGFNALPPAAQKLLAQHLPGWKIVTSRDLSEDDQPLWSENYGDKCPGIVEGNFATAHSVAVSLMQKKNDNVLQTLILLEPNKDGYELHTLSEASENAVPNVILKLPPGTYKDAERTTTVRTKLDGVAYIKLEAAGTLYYKTPKGFKSLEISE